MNDFAVMPDENLIAALRQAASIWFKNSDLFLLEELIRRLRQYSGDLARAEAEIDRINCEHQ